MTPGQRHLSDVEISAFIDGELTTTAAHDLKQHLNTCHACALKIVAATQLKAATIRLSKRTAAPPDALTRLTAQLRQEEPKKLVRTYPVNFWSWTALAASLILVLSLAGWMQIRRSAAITAELLDQHLAVLSSGSSPEVLSSDRHTVKPWYQGKLPFSFNLPDTLPPNTTLDGGNLTYLHGQPAALLLFTIGKHRASVFLTQRSTGNSALLSGTNAGFNIRRAGTRELLITGVSDANSSDLALLVSALAEAQSPR
jgi:anti-sigma factor RsiW